eukprot:994341-Pelagomonas_calceolata.AAC.6
MGRGCGMEQLQQCCVEAAQTHKLAYLPSSEWGSFSDLGLHFKTDHLKRMSELSIDICCLTCPGQKGGHLGSQSQASRCAQVPC